MGGHEVIVDGVEAWRGYLRVKQAGEIKLEVECDSADIGEVSGRAIQRWLLALPHQTRPLTRLANFASQIMSATTNASQPSVS
jgi:hypothetical protein